MAAILYYLYLIGGEGGCFFQSTTSFWKKKLSDFLNTLQNLSDKVGFIQKTA